VMSIVLMSLLLLELVDSIFSSRSISGKTCSSVVSDSS
jgi:hypothetical protein